MPNVKPRALLGFDLETTGVTDTNEFGRISIIEVGAMLIDFDLNVIDSYQGVVKMNAEIAGRLKLPENRIALEMHRGTGLLEEALHGSDVETPEGPFHVDPLTLAETEDELIEMLEQSDFQPGELIMFGSGVTNYDFPMVKEHMRKLVPWLTYFSIDIGITRRAVNMLGGRKIVGANASGPDAAHRAIADIQHALEEARQLRGWLRAATDAIGA